MKNKKTIIIISVVTILIVLSAIAVYAGVNQTNSFNIFNRYENRNDAPKTKKLILNSNNTAVMSGSKIQIANDGEQLEYKETVNYDENLRFDVYTDKNKNEYRYDLSGKLTDFIASAEVTDYERATFDGTPISEKEAVSLALKYATKLFGNRADGYELEKVSLLQDKTYLITYVKRFGEDKFLIGPYLFVELLPTGDLITVSFSREDMFDDFDFSLLDGITEQTIKDYVHSQLILQNKDNIPKYNFYSINLKKDGEKFSICASIELEIVDPTFILPDGEPYTISSMKEYYYELG